jgi:uncharacterized protein
VAQEEAQVPADPVPEVIALLAAEAADENAVRSVFDADPWTVHTVFRIKDVRRWTLWLDGR